MVPPLPPFISCGARDTLQLSHLSLLICEVRGGAGSFLSVFPLEVFEPVVISFCSSAASPHQKSAVSKVWVSSSNLSFMGVGLGQASLVGTEEDHSSTQVISPCSDSGPVLVYPAPC